MRYVLPMNNNLFKEIDVGSSMSQTEFHFEFCLAAKSCKTGTNWMRLGLTKIKRWKISHVLLSLAQYLVNNQVKVNSRPSKHRNPL
jgi:hypothetical protein